ncbi:SCO family protein [Rhizobium sp. P40RR-XXII]|uniref:SCO family protein n=1 Tax=Rhizobium sp. P40RR-XXII TaxID=2726739 RepID=UPI0014570E0E|nr:SCO family protein [Rhizobium sp. P40RR-XXII]NLS17662.1 SCO family protein [Rhizobium sp. P40RR-XXII]
MNVGGLLLAFALLCCAIPSNATGFDPFAATGIERGPDARIPLDQAFQDENGARVTLRQLGAGKPILLAPVLHNCPNICGVTLSGLMEAIQAQPFRSPSDFTLVAFGIDPREGPTEARASLDRLRRRFPSLAANGVHALTGDASAVHAITAALGYRYAWEPEIGQYAHAAAVAVLTPEGRLSRWLYGLAPTSRDLQLALTEAGEGHVGNWGDQLLVLCYHYDPHTGRYSPLILTGLQWSAGLSAVVGLCLLARVMIRERGTKQTGRRLP